LHLEAKPLGTQHDVLSEEARRAWGLLHEGWQRGGAAEFDTDYSPMFCVRGVTRYLTLVGGRFRQAPRTLLPSRLIQSLDGMGAADRSVYSLDDPEIRRNIEHVRSNAGLPPLFEYSPRDADPLAYADD